jgi:hypothetical protein
MSILTTLVSTKLYIVYPRAYVVDWCTINPLLVKPAQMFQRPRRPYFELVRFGEEKLHHHRKGSLKLLTQRKATQEKAAPLS